MRAVARQPAKAGWGEAAGGELAGDEHLYTPLVAARQPTLACCRAAAGRKLAGAAQTTRTSTLCWPPPDSRPGVDVRRRQARILLWWTTSTSTLFGPPPGSRSWLAVGLLPAAGGELATGTSTLYGSPPGSRPRPAVGRQQEGSSLHGPPHCSCSAGRRLAAGFGRLLGGTIHLTLTHHHCKPTATGHNPISQLHIHPPAHPHRDKSRAEPGQGDPILAGHTQDYVGSDTHLTASPSLHHTSKLTYPPHLHMVNSGSFWGPTFSLVGPLQAFLRCKEEPPPPPCGRRSCRVGFWWVPLWETERIEYCRSCRCRATRTMKLWSNSSCCRE